MAEYILEITVARYEGEDGKPVIDQELKEEIVRCKDCRFFHDTDPDEKFAEYGGLCRLWGEQYAHYEAYCAYGDRREDHEDS